jgi:hypothetical protein
MLGLLAIANVVGSSTWRAGATDLWIASVEDTTSTYFHTTNGKTSLYKNRLRMFIWLFCILNTLIIAFRAQDHKSAGRDTTLLTPSWTWREDPATTTVATTQHYSFSFNYLLNCREDLWIVKHLCLILYTHFSFICRKLVLDMQEYILLCLFFRLSVQGGSENRSISRRIYGSCVNRGHGPRAPFIHRLIDEYRVPHISPGAMAPRPTMFVGATSF